MLDNILYILLIKTLKRTFANNNKNNCPLKAD